MTRRYGHVIAVTATHSGHAPVWFRWNGTVYHVVEVFGTWHLRDRWWATGAPIQSAAGHTGAASDRYYYRVRCASGLICDLYHDVVSDAWVLDCVYD